MYQKTSVQSTIQTLNMYIWRSTIGMPKQTNKISHHMTEGTCITRTNKRAGTWRHFTQIFHVPDRVRTAILTV